MSRKYEGFIVALEDSGWRSNSYVKGHPLWVDNESFSLGKEIINNEGLVNAGRVANGSSQISGAVKPTASFTYQPRNKDILPILYSHFQMGTQLTEETAPGTYIFVPARTTPTFTEDDERSSGDFSSTAKDVYSLTFIKKYFSDNEAGDGNCSIFKHGLCDKLTVNLEVGKDVTFDCEYKFRDLTQSNNLDSTPPDATLGTYETTPPMEWHHGTVSVVGQNLDLESISFTGNNNLVERIEIGRRDPENFAFRGYEVTGQFTVDFPKDGFDQIERLFNNVSFSIEGTIMQGTVAMMFDMPYCIRQPFDVSLNDDLVKMTIPFRALEDDGTSPITIKLIAGGESEAFDDDILDAYSGARTFGEFAIYDAASGVRTLNEYTYYDRDL